MYFACTTASKGVGFWMQTNSSKPQSVEPSAKYQLLLILGGATPVLRGLATAAPQVASATAAHASRAVIARRPLRAVPFIRMSASLASSRVRPFDLRF